MSKSDFCLNLKRHKRVHLNTASSAHITTFFLKPPSFLHFFRMLLKLLASSLLPHFLTSDNIALYSRFFKFGLIGAC
jgi:hypothetical protein